MELSSLVSFFGLVDLFSGYHPFFVRSDGFAVSIVGLIDLFFLVWGTSYLFCELRCFCGINFRPYWNFFYLFRGGTGVLQWIVTATVSCFWHAFSGTFFCLLSWDPIWVSLLGLNDLFFFWFWFASVQSVLACAQDSLFVVSNFCSLSGSSAAYLGPTSFSPKWHFSGSASRTAILEHKYKPDICFYPDRLTQPFFLDLLRYFSFF